MTNFLSILFISLIAVPAFADETEVGAASAVAVTGVGLADYTYHKHESEILAKDYDGKYAQHRKKINALVEAREARIRELFPELIAEQKALVKKYGSRWSPEPGDLGYSEANSFGKRYSEAVFGNAELNTMLADINKKSEGMHFKGKAYEDLKSRNLKASTADLKKARGLGVAAIGVGAFVYMMSRDEKVEAPADFSAPATEDSKPEPVEINANLGE